MKKNFLAIASLLIAAMLLMVSCNQEVAPVDNGRVKASLLIDDSRKLVVRDDIGDVTYKFRLDNQWTDLSIENGSKQDVYGETPAETWKDLPQDKSLGYVTQGLWTVSVRGYKGNDVVLEGSVNHYFNTQSTVVMVPVVPSEGTGKVNLTIQMNDLEKDDTSYYGLSYSLVALNGDTVNVENNPFSVNKGNDGDNATYTVSELGLAAGYYLLTVNVTETVGSTTKYIGGSTITFLVINEGTVDIKGYVEPNTFDNDTVKIDIIAAKPVLSLTDASNLTIGSDVVFGLSDEASENYIGYDHTVEYVVYVDGEIKTLNEDYTISDAELTVKKDTFGQIPGPKTVTLVKKVTVTPFGRNPTTIMGSYQIDVKLEPKTN